MRSNKYTHWADSTADQYGAVDVVSRTAELQPVQHSIEASLQQALWHDTLLALLWPLADL